MHSGTGGLNRLFDLELGFNLLTGEIPRACGNAPSLRYAARSGNNFTGAIPPGLGNLVRLNDLILDANDLEGEFPEELSGLVTLEHLSLVECLQSEQNGRDVVARLGSM